MMYAGTLQQESSALVPLDARVSVFHGAHSTKPAAIMPLATVLRDIQEGRWKTPVEHLRALGSPRDEAEYKRVKEKLDAFTPCCVLSTRDKDTAWDTKLLSVTGLVHYDLDHLEDPEAVKGQLATHPSVAFAFTSPSGTGLKIGVAVRDIRSRDAYRHAWSVVRDILTETCPDGRFSEDPHVKYLQALCFVSYDPTLYHNPCAVPLDIPAPQPKAIPKPQPETRLTYQQVAEALTCIPNDDAEYDRWLQLGMALHSTGALWARGLWDAWSQQSTKYDDRKQTKSWGSFTSTGSVTIGSLFHLARQYGYSRQEDRHDWHSNGHSNGTHTNGHTNGVHTNGSVNGHRQETPAEPEKRSVDMETIEQQPVDWLWEPYVALGKLCMLDGDPGVGKTLLAIQLAANLSRGFPFPDQHGKLTLTSCDKAPTLFIAMEDDLADTVKPRLVNAGADCRLIKVLNEAPDAHGRTHPVTLDDLPYIEREIQRIQPRLVVIDSIQAVLGGRVDIHRANQVTEKLRLLADLARRYHCAIMCIRHPSKPGQSISKLIHRGTGSVAFIGTARLGLFVEEHPTDRTKVLLLQAKSNAGSPACTQIFSKQHGIFSWAGVTRLTSNDLAGSGHGPDPSATLGAYLWLEHRLRDGRSYPATEIQDEMKEEGFKNSTLWEAKKRLGVSHTRTPAGTYTWHLPPLPPLSTTSTTETTETTETSTTSMTSMTLTETMTYEDICPASEQVSGVVEVSEVSEVSEVIEVSGVVTEGIPVGIPCALCDGLDRWNDDGVPRCVTCEPPEAH